VTVSIHFHQKWQSIFRDVIKSKNTAIFGIVSNYFWRIAYQSGGALHVHCDLWIKDAPVLRKSSPVSVAGCCNGYDQHMRGEPVNFEFISTLAVPFGKTCYIIMCYIIIITSAKEVM